MKENQVNFGLSSLQRVRQQILGCEVCSESASHPFRGLVETVIGRLDAAHFLSNAHLLCPVCSTPLAKSTLVRTEADAETDTKYFEPCWEETTIVLIDEEVLLATEKCFNGCEHCSDDAEITLDYVLDHVTGCDPTVTEYVLCRPASCPTCRREVTEKTFVVVR